MVNQKSILYREAKALAQTLNIPSPRWTGSTIQSLQQFINDNTRPDLPFLEQIRNYIRGIKQLRLRNQTAEEFMTQVRRLLTPGINYYYTIKTDSGDSIRLRRGTIISSSSPATPFYELYLMLIAIMENSEEYLVSSDYIDIQFHREVTINPPLQNQRDCTINCACKAVLDVMTNYKQTEPVKRRIKRVN